ncbi:hypothetical protein [Spirochaeta thermophila]|uniref:Lipoprotein n=1 Tax=Winmispira thermophila (strain ATCC 49972 / DSM 6192 / RI 19.B1) TaxID=665571 RepID=E0RTY4_WINT6|nr:hypothetical protein [Spirochaeta thermophila]ADN01040.1 hypothetical protein STHERM_c00640 [Spirochaeta thermophila DSM 6192]
MKERVLIVVVLLVVGCGRWVGGEEVGGEGGGSVVRKEEGVWARVEGGIEGFLLGEGWEREPHRRMDLLYEGAVEGRYTGEGQREFLVAYRDYRVSPVNDSEVIWAVVSFRFGPWGIEGKVWEECYWDDRFIECELFVESSGLPVAETARVEGGRRLGPLWVVDVDMDGLEEIIEVWEHTQFRQSSLLVTGYNVLQKRWEREKSFDLSLEVVKEHGYGIGEVVIRPGRVKVYGGREGWEYEAYRGVRPYVEWVWDEEEGEWVEVERGYEEVEKEAYEAFVRRQEEEGERIWRREWERKMRFEWRWWEGLVKVMEGDAEWRVLKRAYPGVWEVNGEPEALPTWYRRFEGEGWGEGVWYLVKYKGRNKESYRVEEWYAVVRVEGDEVEVYDKVEVGGEKQVRWQPDGGGTLKGIWKGTLKGEGVGVEVEGGWYEGGMWVVDVDGDGKEELVDVGWHKEGKYTVDIIKWEGELKTRWRLPIPGYLVRRVKIEEGRIECGGVWMEEEETTVVVGEGPYVVWELKEGEWVKVEEGEEEWRGEEEVIVEFDNAFGLHLHHWVEIMRRIIEENY